MDLKRERERDFTPRRTIFVQANTLYTDLNLFYLKDIKLEKLLYVFLLIGDSNQLECTKGWTKNRETESTD